MVLSALFGFGRVAHARPEAPKGFEMIIAIVIVAIIAVAAVIYVRHHAAVAAQIDTDATKLKNAAEAEAKKIEADIEANAKKIDAAVQTRG
jgi:Tfp pilus assembly protein PilX